MSLADFIFGTAISGGLSIVAMRRKWPEKIIGLWSRSGATTSASEIGQEEDNPGNRFIQAHLSDEIGANELLDTEVTHVVCEALRSLGDAQLEGLRNKLDQKFPNDLDGLNSSHWHDADDLYRLRFLTIREQGRRSGVLATLKAGALLRDAMKAPLDQQA